ncbi:2OG-Fe(II) oxygenase [Pseudoalteromonas phenolica]|jgi:Rps23 Pro-64 3,4-dihydroxylase Tpa1-like proline 4-hydroxylase|uniref:2OG-Fe(II) oxygenase n=1 Tax=Pseudoalteromonas phenolica TaxID=161398 RepID=UPI00384E99EE
MEIIREQEFEKLAKLSNPLLCNAFIDSLDKKLACERQKNNVDNLDNILIKKADFLRRSGQLGKAKSIYSLLDKSTQNPQQDAQALHIGSIVDKDGYNTMPAFILDNLFSTTDTAALLKHVADKQTSFKLAGYGYNSTEHNENARKTHFLAINSDFKALFNDFINSNIDKIRNALNIPSFTIESIEIKLTNHIDGGFFQVHSDNSALFGEQTTRVISWIYYFHEQPKQFSGGELYAFDTNLDSREYNPNSFTKITPNHNRFVAFPSCYYHCVAPTNVPSKQFMHGRMAVVGHIHFSERT